MKKTLVIATLSLLLVQMGAIAQGKSPTNKLRAQNQMPPQTVLNEESIDNVINAGLMKKDANGNFNPDGIISRAELATILVKTFKLETREAAKKSDLIVKDVPKTHWAYRDVQIVLKTGTMTGYRDGMFFPNQRVNRAEAFAIIAQAYGVFQFPDQNVKQILSEYPDAAEIPSWAQKSLATALYEGFVNTEAGTSKIQPLQPMTRRDLAYALNKYLERQTTPAPLRQ